jgi:DNA helicase-2/ATP-dependent DNA helicase PcrA
MDREAVPVWLEGIQGPYLPRFIESDAKILRVVAGPGSGKTAGLKKRILRLIERDGVEPGRMFVGTFTRAIAQDLVEELGDAVARGIRVSTLHGLALRLLRDNPPARVGYRLRFLLGYEEEAMLYDIGLELHDNRRQSERDRDLKRLQSSWAERRPLPDAAFAGTVERWLRWHGAMLIGEVVPLATRALESGDVPRGAFDEVMVDEYQDLTACEQRLVELVWSGERSLVVLGDDNQSIYSFRFNHPGGITEFGERLHVEDHVIPENRRSAEPIVDFANAMMAEGGSTKDPMIARNTSKGRVDLVHWPSLEAEVEGLGRYLAAQPFPYLVLVGRRLIGHRLADAVGPDAQTSFYQEVLEHQIAQERFALASVLADADDLVAIRAWLGFDDTEPAQAPGRNCEAYASARASGLSGRALLEGIVSGAVTVHRTGRGNVVARARAAMEHLMAAPQDTVGLIAYAFDPNAAAAEGDAEKHRWVRQDIEALRAGALVYAGEGRDFRSVVDSLRYAIATRTPLRLPATARVRIMTLHSAKGLQADRVIVAGAAGQIIPGIARSDPSADAAHRAEQRRLLYVAVTRAKVELVVSWPLSVSYADASAAFIAIDSGAVFKEGGERRVRTGRTALLPGYLPGVRSGASWLAANVATEGDGSHAD